MANSRKKPLESTCPCGSLLTYEQCCQRWHNQANGLYAPDAETLMRSRYSAYVLNHLPYLLATWHHSTRPSDLEPNPPNLKWLGLSIRSHQTLSTTQAEVEFVARHRLDGKATRLHERSRFVYENGQWFYLDGIFL
ncbi:MAG TPA: YchJ family metal-binding protein [Paenalcaligenes sp.]|nr:YchJ family metal-binding protein [Paenalcaligenes sp.]